MTSRGLAAGTVISGKYKLIGHLGGGGMGDVYRAEHQLAGRLVAIKVLRPDLAANPDVTRRFFQEAQAVNRIRHPNIVDVLDADFSQQGPYVVMECLEGASVAYALSKLGKLDLATSLAIILPTLDALHAAHEHGIIHRDLKPENIFIAATPNGEPRVKLLDFGIAKILHQGGAQTNTGVVFGTPDYLSPEQASGDPAIDGRSDLFSVGTLIFELLSGRRPFEAANAVATAYRIVHAQAPQLSAIGVHVHPAIQRVLDTALAKDKTDRFANAAAFAEALLPIAPDSLARMAMLRALYESTIALSPTLAAPGRSAPSLSFEPSLPVPLHEALPLSQEDSHAEPPKPVSHEPGAVAPTLVSREFVVPRARESGPASRRSQDRISEPKIVDRPSAPRSISSTPSPPSRASTPSARPRMRSSPLFARPLPDGVHGRCHVRGTLPRACALWIERSHTRAKRDDVLAVLPQRLAETYRADAFNALVWYDVEALHEFLEQATHHALLDDPTGWRLLARENFERDLAPIFRPSAARTDAMTLLRRLPAGLARVFDFGTTRIDENGSNRVRVKLSGFEAASTALRFITLGPLDGMLGGTPGLVVRLVSGESSFAPDFEVDVHWREIAR